MRLNRKLLLACISVLVVLGGGCSGINASKSFSPATFLLPGLMKAEPAPPAPEKTPPAEEPGTRVAQL